MDEVGEKTFLVCKKRPFPVNGQGTFLYTTRKALTFSVLVGQDNPLCKDKDAKPNEYIALHVEDNKVQFAIKFESDVEEKKLKEITSKAGEDDVGVQHNITATYWYSYDRDGLTLKYGKGYVMEETTMMSHDFLTGCKTKEEKEKVRKKYSIFFNPMQRKCVWVYATEKEWMEFPSYITTQPNFQFYPDPFTCNYPALIMDSNDVTLFSLDNGEMMFSGSLPSACQKLYANIKGLTLEYPENPIMKLSDAIRYSMKTKGCILFDKLKSKAHEFGPDAPTNMTYLRVTLGPDRRTAPGIPYVLEIWPSSHLSPIHNHGGACAIIKVLFGRITINLYNKQTDPPSKKPKVIRQFDAKKDDITWISPDWFQTHHLENRTDDFCATIQCYRYTDEDKIHWPDFDYLSVRDGKAALDQFFPTSDFSFVHLRSKVLEEYQAYLGGNVKLSIPI